MHDGVWLLIFLRKEQMQMKLVLAEKPSVAQSIAKVLGAAKDNRNRGLHMAFLWKAADQ